MIISKRLRTDWVCFVHQLCSHTELNSYVLPENCFLKHNRGAWRAIVYGVAESDMTEQLSTAQHSTRRCIKCSVRVHSCGGTIPHTKDPGQARAFIPLPIQKERSHTSSAPALRLILLCHVSRSQITSPWGAPSRPGLSNVEATGHMKWNEKFNSSITLITFQGLNSRVWPRAIVLGSIHTDHLPPSQNFISIINFLWGIVDLYFCVSFCHTAQWISYT